MKEMSNLRIVTLCKERGVKQADLAEKLGVRRTSLSNAISKNTLSVKTLEMIAGFLEVDVLDLFDDLRSEKIQKFSCPHCGKQISVEIK